jgi:hypothetical protein
MRIFKQECLKKLMDIASLYLGSFYTDLYKDLASEAQEKANTPCARTSALTALILAFA